MNLYHFIVLGILVGYIFGSIPFGLIIGKRFYHKDVRTMGSNNLGATNVARTLGPVAGISVLILDTVKGGLPGLILYKIAYAYFVNSQNPELISQLPYLSMVYCVTGMAACTGHSHPLFANFKGGKCVTTMLGFVLFHNVKLALFPFLAFLIVMIIFRIVSIGSLTACIGVMICIFIPWCQDAYLFRDIAPLVTPSLFVYKLAIMWMGILLIYRHLANIQRILKGEEKKFSFAKKEKN